MTDELAIPRGYSRAGGSKGHGDATIAAYEDATADQSSQPAFIARTAPR